MHNIAVAETAVLSPRLVNVLTLGTTELRFEAIGGEPVGDTAAEGRQS